MISLIFLSVLLESDKIIGIFIWTVVLRVGRTRVPSLTLFRSDSFPTKTLNSNLVCLFNHLLHCHITNQLFHLAHHIFILLDSLDTVPDYHLIIIINLLQPNWIVHLFNMLIHSIVIETDVVHNTIKNRLRMVEDE